MRKILKGAASALIVSGMVFGSSLMASAEEVTPEETPAVEVVQTPVVEEIPAPVVEEPAPEVAKQPVEEAPAPVEVTPQAEAPQVAPSAPPVDNGKKETKTIKWILPNGGTSSNVTWPQPLFDATSVKCGTTVTVQVDVYPYHTKKDKERTDALDDDGVLKQGEDYGWVKSWSFETYTAPACHVPPTPAPVVYTDFVCNGDASIDITETAGVVYLYTIDGSAPAHIGDITIPWAVKENAIGKSILIWATDTVTGKTLAEWPFTFTDPGSCEIPPVAANPTAVVTATCGTADLILTNPLVKDANQLTASFVVNVDGKFHKAYSVEAGNRVEDAFEFAEDSGNHTIEVFQAGTSEWKLIASADVKSDCEVPPTTEPPVVNPPVVQPPVVNPAPVVADNKTADVQTLAQTGLEGTQLWAISAGVIAVMVLGAGFILWSALRNRRPVVETIDE